MAAVTATACGSMCIVGARKTASRAAFINSALLPADPTAGWGTHESEVGSAQTFSPRGRTVSLPEPALFRLRSPRACRYTGCYVHDNLPRSW